MYIYQFVGVTGPISISSTVAVFQGLTSAVRTIISKVLLSIDSIKLSMCDDFNVKVSVLNLYSTSSASCLFTWKYHYLHLKNSVLVQFPEKYILDK